MLNELIQRHAYNNNSNINPLNSRQDKVRQGKTSQDKTRRDETYIDPLHIMTMTMTISMTSIIQ